VINDNPDATTLAFFRESFRKAGVIEELFEMFESYLRFQDLQARGGQIIDATLVPVARQRNNREDNKEIKENRVPEGWDETQSDCSRGIWKHAWLKRMVSITTAIRTISVLMWNMDLSDALP